MGRSYRTASANPLDYIYSINTPLMEKAISANDAAITNSLDVAGQTNKLLSYNYLPADEQDATAIANNYQKQIDDIAQTIRKDPANWRKQLDPMRTLRQSLQEDYTRGAIGKQIANYNKRKQDFDAIDKQVDLYHKSGGVKGVDPNRAALKKSYLDNQFEKTGYDKATGKYNIYKGGNVMDNIDVRKRLSDGFDKLKADGVIRTGEGITPGGEYFNKVTNKWEGLTQDKLLGLVTNRLKGDNQLWDYLKEDTQIGNIRGVYDDNGGIISPYNVSAIPKSKQEQAQIDLIQSKIDKAKDPKVREQLQKQLNTHINQAPKTTVNWNSESYLAPIMRGIVDQYAYSKTESSNDLSNNSVWNTKYTQAQTNARQGRSLAQAKALHDDTQKNLEDRFQKRLDFDKYKWDNPHVTTKGTLSPKPTVKNGKVELPEETGVERIATNSFEDWTTRDVKSGTPVPVLSNAGLSSDIDQFKNELDKINSEIKTIDRKNSDRLDINNPVAVNNYKQLELKKERLLIKQKTLESDLNERRKWYKVSTDNALSKLTLDEKQMYNKYTDKGIQIIKNEIEQLRQKHPDKRVADLTNNGGMSANQVVQAPEVVEANNKLQKYITVKNKIDKDREGFLETLRKDHIDEDGIKLGKQDSENVASMILANPRGLQLYDNNGDKTDGIELDKKGLALTPGRDNKNFTFADGSLSDYISNSATDIIVKSVAPTTKLGNGNAVFRVQFNDPTGEIPKNKDYYIVSTPELQRQIATKFKGHKNPEISSIANNIGDDLANSMRNQLAKPNIGEDQRFVLKVPDNQGNTLPLNVTKIDNHYNVTFTNQDGEEVPLPSLSGKPGFFNGSAELIKSFKAVKDGSLK